LYNDLSNSSLFGSQHSDIIQNSSRSRIRRSVDESVASNKKESWKSLRDFAVEREIEEVIERIDEDRSILEVKNAVSVSFARVLNLAFSHVGPPG
jgi:hypothetical protein